METLRADHLVKDYKGARGTIRALDDVSFTVQRGEIIAVIGASGSGKSTLFHILGSVDRPTGGTVYLNDQNIFEQNEEQLAIFRRREVGIIYQFNTLLPLLTVRENILLPAMLDSTTADEDDYRMIVERLVLAGLEDAFPEELSGGQQQRVAIARTLISKPSVVLSDEPTGNLDRINAQAIMDLFKWCNRQYRQTILFITHDDTIARQADRVLCLKNGKLANGDPDR